MRRRDLLRRGGRDKIRASMETHKGLQFNRSLALLVKIPFLAFMVAFLSLHPAGKARAAEVLDKVVAVVNDEVITQSELDQLLFRVYQQYKKTFSKEKLAVKMNQARQQILNQLIEDRLVYQEAKKLKVPVTDEEVNARAMEFRARFKSQEEFEKILGQQGLNETKLKERYREQIAIRKLQQYEVRSKIIVTPKDIEGYYQKHLSKFTQKERIKVRTITLRKSEEAIKKKTPDPAVKTKAQDILTKLYSGMGFEDLAKQFSEDTKAAKGGDLGMVKRGDLVNRLEQVLFNMKPGEISPILETEMGYHIFKVEGKKERTSKTIDEVRDQISDHLYRKKSRLRFQEWVTDLKKNAYISIR